MTEIKYPVGVQNFPEIINEAYLYVDKTRDIYELVKRNKYVFLSRPRRFGKSLLISTIENYFKGRKELFRGLAIEELEKEWETYPVFRFDFTGRSYETPEDVSDSILSAIRRWEEDYRVELFDENEGERFFSLIKQVSERLGKRVVVLVDEYDKPIIDVLEDSPLQDKVTKRLQGFYSVLKKADEYIKFAMITGVGKFAHLSIFSGLNNLTDISMTIKYNTICGITESEMHQYFEESMKDYSDTNEIAEEEAWAEFKEQYDGYHFSQKGADIYNPYSVLNAFSLQSISDYWFSKGTPSFLVKLLRRNRVPLINLDRQWRSESDLSDMTDTTRDVIPLLFQAGYLTLRTYDPRRRQYQLDFPNREVYAGFWESLVKAYFPRDINPSGFDVFTLTDCLNSGDINGFMTSVGSLIASATTDHIVNREEHFQNMMAIICRMLGLQVQTEIHGAGGRCDMIALCTDYIYIFEFKINSTPDEALSQIEENGYEKPYLADSRKKILVGGNFSTETRTLTGWVAARCE